MKFLAVILSIYIFALNLAPCEDSNALDNGFKSEISQIMDNDHKHQNTDLCSPFCICQCCHISPINIKFVDVNINTPYISIQDFFCQNGTEKDFTTSILQPPRA